MKTQQDLGSSLISLLADRSLGLPLIASVGDVIAADARFNHWIALEGKRKLSQDAMLQTINVYEDATIKCRAAIERFITMRDDTPLEAALENTLQVLKRALQS